MDHVRRPRPAHPGTDAAAPKRPVCRKCGYDEVYPSRIRWFDLPLLPLLRPCRCNKCYRRSYTWHGRPARVFDRRNMGW